jgi:hypothetical protein
MNSSSCDRGERYYVRHLTFLRLSLLLILGTLAFLSAYAVLWRFLGWSYSMGVFGFSLLLVTLWQLPKYQASHIPDIKDRLTIENAARQTLAQMIGGVVLIADLFFTWANLKITQDTTTKNLEMTREGQITDRFTKAVAQLGERDEEKLAVRLGGIYALERIAMESEEDRMPVVDVLMAYVREYAPWPPKRAEEPSTIPKEVHPTADIQTILTWLGVAT